MESMHTAAEVRYGRGERGRLVHLSCCKEEMEALAGSMSLRLCSVGPLRAEVCFVHTGTPVPLGHQI